MLKGNKCKLLSYFSFCCRCVGLLLQQRCFALMREFIKGTSESKLYAKASRTNLIKYNSLVKNELVTSNSLATVSQMLSL